MTVSIDQDQYRYQEEQRIQNEMRMNEERRRMNIAAEQSGNAPCCCTIF